MQLKLQTIHKIPNNTIVTTNMRQKTRQKSSPSKWPPLQIQRQKARLLNLLGSRLQLLNVPVRPHVLPFQEHCLGTSKPDDEIARQFRYSISMSTIHLVNSFRLISSLLFHPNHSRVSKSVEPRTYDHQTQ